MLKRLKDNFTKGIERVKWFATVFSERLKIEITVIKLLYRSDEMDKRRDELLREIGSRVYELKGHPERNLLKDRVVLESIKEIEKIEKDVNELKQQVSEVSKVGV
jgi:hypothetical protein